MLVLECCYIITANAEQTNIMFSATEIAFTAAQEQLQPGAPRARPSQQKKLFTPHGLLPHMCICSDCRLRICFTFSKLGRHKHVAPDSSICTSSLALSELQAGQPTADLETAAAAAALLLT
jgi:hypothetical protein